jgi:steroid delta-isomerase-like uncharacterized protein
MTGHDGGSAPVDDAFLREVLAQAISIFNAHDVSGFVALMTEDVVLEHSAAPRTMHGREEVGTFYRESLWKAFPDLTLELADGPFFHPDAPRVSIRWLVTGTHTGPLDPPGLASTGKHVAFDAREVADFRDGLVSRISLVVDMADAMRQLGVLPVVGSRAERAMARVQRLRMMVSRHR